MRGLEASIFSPTGVLPPHRCRDDREGTPIRRSRCSGSTASQRWARRARLKAATFSCSARRGGGKMEQITRRTADRDRSASRRRPADGGRGVRSAASPRRLGSHRIVLAVSFLSLGCGPAWSSHCSIPLVSASSFSAWSPPASSLQRISLGALIIALGLLVDDAMITIEMMVASSRRIRSKHAATMPRCRRLFLLTGTLVTAAGIPADRFRAQRRRAVLLSPCSWSSPDRAAHLLGSWQSSSPR